MAGPVDPRSVRDRFRRLSEPTEFDQRGRGSDQFKPLRPHRAEIVNALEFAFFYN